MNARIGQTGLPASYVAKLWATALASARSAWGVKLSLPRAAPGVDRDLVLGPYGLVFLAVAIMMRIPEASTALTRFTRR